MTRELKPGLCNNLEGWDGEGQEGRDICIPMADSFMFMFGRNQHKSVKQLSFN